MQEVNEALAKVYNAVRHLADHSFWGGCWCHTGDEMAVQILRAKYREISIAAFGEVRIPSMVATEILRAKLI